MNYNDVVNRFKEIVGDHRMLVDFGYGQISDIKTRSEGMGELEGADYPYLFLNPAVHQRTESQITYNFNMIIMDMAREEVEDPYQNFLNIQSDCIQYCDDVLARLRYHYKDKPEILFQLGYTPFYERFQDDLAGVTANISIVVPNSINECIAPFNNETLINRVYVNVEQCPAYDTAFRTGPADYVNYPQYTKQYNEFYARYDQPGEFTNCGQYFTPLAINDRNSTTEPYYNAASRRWTIPAGVGGVFHLDFNLEMTNVQGIDLSEDRLRVQLIINGQTNTYYDLPELPIDGTPVAFNKRFTVDASSDEDEFTILFRYQDEGTPAPDGPLVGYTGTAEIYRVGDPVITPPTPTPEPTPTPTVFEGIRTNSLIIPGGNTDLIPLQSILTDTYNGWEDRVGSDKYRMPEGTWEEVITITGYYDSVNPLYRPDGFSNVSLTSQIQWDLPSDSSSILMNQPVDLGNNLFQFNVTNTWVITEEMHNDYYPAGIWLSTLTSSFQDTLRIDTLNYKINGPVA